MSYSLQDYLEGTVSRHDLLAYSRIFDNEESQQALQEFFRCEDQRNAAINKVFKAARKQMAEHTQSRTSSSSSSAATSLSMDDPITADGGCYVRGGGTVRSPPTSSSSTTKAKAKIRAPYPEAPSSTPPAKRSLVGFPVFQNQNLQPAIADQVASGIKK
jgi:hypothetical protein